MESKEIFRSLKEGKLWKSPGKLRGNITFEKHTFTQVIVSENMKSHTVAFQKNEICVEYESIWKIRLSHKIIRSSKQNQIIKFCYRKRKMIKISKIEMGRGSTQVSHNNHVNRGLNGVDH